VNAANPETLEPAKRKVLAIVTVLFCLGLAAILARSPTIPVQSDLFARWYAARELREQGRSLYDARNGEEVARLKSLPTSGLEAGFYYPAYLLVVTGPLSWLPFPAAHFIWTASGLLMLLTALWQVSAAWRWPSGSNGLAWLVFASIFFIPVLQHAIWSQFDVLGALGLALSLVSLRRGGFWLAGVWAAGVLFKPQGTLLVGVFLCAWAVSSQRRWGFLAGFGGAAIGLWALAEILQPGWVPEFLAALRAYQQLPYQIRSVMDNLWNPGQIVSGLLAASVLLLAVIDRRVEADEKAFAALVVYSLAVTWLVVPVIGMLYLVLFPIALVVLMGSASVEGQRRVALAVFAALYLAGLGGFIYALAGGAPSGQHILLVELAYKTAGPLVMAAAAAIFLFQARAK
jgi:hypothetical protein